MSGQGAVLQVVILRDGLLVGTEVFVPGTYVLGSAATADLKLEDPAVHPNHAVLYFKNGRAAIQDSGSPSGVFVNGHRVKACEVRSQDEVTCGPFLLKVRVLAKAPAEKVVPPPDIAALLKTPAHGVALEAQRRAPEGKQATVGAIRGEELAATVPGGGAKAHGHPQTVFSARRKAEAATPWADGSNGALEDPTEAISVLPRDVIEKAKPRRDPPTTPHGMPEPPPHRPAGRHRAAKPRVPAIREGRGPARLYFELWWGDTRQGATAFKRDRKRPVIARGDEGAPLPLYGFDLPEDGFVIAETRSKGFRVYVPPGSAVESKKGDAFYPVASRDLEVSGHHRFVSLTLGSAARFSHGEMSLVAYVAPPPERVWVSPLFGVPWLALACLSLALLGFGTFLYYAPKPADLPDFTAKSLPPVAVRLMRPEPKKKEEAKKALEKIKEVAEKKEVAKKPERPRIAAKEKPPPKEPAAPPPPAQEKALKALSKLTAAGPGTKDLLAAVDKLGNGPGSTKSKNSDFKLSGLIGKAPIANAGLGSFGLGGGGGGGYATKGAELLHGRGAGGIGALGVGGIGRGAVGGTVTRASARNVSVQGSIDREAVAKVVNAHLQEVRGCYERALLKDPALAGKVVLEWSISTEGHVVSAKTKSSTLRNGEVEGCIMGHLKTWEFPKAHGGVVIISYPFLFNSVGY